MSDETLVIFTAKSIETIQEEGGTASWRLDRNHARRCKYAVCTRNIHPRWREGPEGPEPHHAAFLVGKISDIVPVKRVDKPGVYYLIRFSEFARVNVAETWKGDRNPVKYSSSNDLGIDFTKLKWEPMPESAVSTHAVEAASAPQRSNPSASTVGELTMAEAKKGLALTFNVPPEAIEIIIRG
jgi:hypothetical protein